MSYTSPKISLGKINQHDLGVIANSCEKYHQDLLALLEQEHSAQQYIHLSILQAFRYELLKKITNRFQAKSVNIKMETFTAFVCFDALQHYSNHCDNHLDQAILRRLCDVLFQELPRTSDKTLSINSELNFN